MEDECGGGEADMKDLEWLREQAKSGLLNPKDELWHLKILAEEAIMKLTETGVKDGDESG